MQKLIASGRRIFAILLLAAAVAWAFGAVLGIGGQRQLFYAEGQEELYDYWMPRMCLEQGYAPLENAELSQWHHGTFITGNVDKVYPALALMPFKLFPATRIGAWSFTVISSFVFLCALLLVTKTSTARVHSSLFPVHLVLIPFTMPFIFALERGNPVWLSAAAVAVFLAWWDAERPWQRYLAAACLAIAAVMKIAPAALGLLYLFPKRASILNLNLQPQPKFPLKEIVIAVVTALVLFILPWLFVKEGFAAIPIMIRNAVHHADYVLRTADFGFVQPWRAVRVALGLGVSESWPGMYLAARLSQLLGLAALVLGARRRDYLLLVGGMLLAAGNMYYYGALYLLPVFIMEFSQFSDQPKPRAALSLVLWFVLLCPLQLVLFGHSGNAILGNLALMALMVLRLWYNRDRI